jgi:hypothetical protein
MPPELIVPEGGVTNIGLRSELIFTISQAQPASTEARDGKVAITGPAAVLIYTTPVFAFAILSATVLEFVTVGI